MTKFDGRTLIKYFPVVWISILGIIISCKALNVGTQLLCANRKDIWRIDTETKAAALVIDGLKRSVAVDYHYAKDVIVWTDVVEENIYSASLKTGYNRTVIVPSCQTPDGVAVDWIHDKVYWTDTGKNEVGVVELDGTKKKVLFDTQVDEPRAIVLNPAEGWMFWSDWGSNAKIERAGMDGTHRSVIVSKNIQWPNGLAIDLPTRRIFWADGRTHVLCTSDYDGNDVRTLIDSPTIMKHPFSLDVFENWLYWTEWSAFQESIYKADKLTGKNITRIIGGTQWTSLMGIRVYHPDKHPPGSNRCEHASCPYLCLPAPKLAEDYAIKYTCVCQAGDPCFESHGTISTIDASTTAASTTTASTTTASTTTASTTTASTTTASTTTTTARATTARTTTANITKTTSSITSSLLTTKFESMDKGQFANDSQRQVQEESYSSAGSTSIILIGVTCGIALLAVVAFYGYKRYMRRNRDGVHLIPPDLDEVL